MPTIDYAADLVEEAVFLAITRGSGATPEEAARWEQEREPLYDQARDGADRERRFRDHARVWFARLRLAGPIDLALRDCPRASAGLARIEVRRVSWVRDEGSELFGPAAVAVESPPAERLPRRMVLGLRPSLFQDPAALREVALREFLYADDALDPAFAFEPVFAPDLAEEPARRELVRDRFRMIWEARIRGRAAAHDGPAARPPAPGPRFLAAFGAARDPGGVEELFRAAWEGRLSTYPALLGAARTGLRPAPARKPAARL